MSKSKNICCCVCYDQLDRPEQPVSTESLLVSLEKSWRVALDDRDEEQVDVGANESLHTTSDQASEPVEAQSNRSAVAICRSHPSLHLACACCAFKMVKEYPTNDRCPLCKGPLASAISMCQRLRLSENRIAAILAQQSDARRKLKEKVQRLCEEFGSRISYTTYFIDAHPEPFSQSTVTVDTTTLPPSRNQPSSLARSEQVNMAWTRKQADNRLAETLSLDIAKYDVFGESEWMRIVEHACGIRLVSTAPVSRKIFQERCDELQTEILLCTRADSFLSHRTDDWLLSDNEETTMREPLVTQDTPDVLSSVLAPQRRPSRLDRESIPTTQSANVSTVPPFLSTDVSSVASSSAPASYSSSGRPNSNYFNYNSASATFRPTSASMMQPSSRHRH